MERVTGVSRRTLLRWHRRGWAPGSAQTPRRDSPRYSAADIELVCGVASLRALGVRTPKAARYARAVLERARQTVAR